MSLVRLLRWELKFQLRYGFYFLYAVLTLFYIVLMSAFPASWRENTAALLIFTDPAAMGLFFMGALVLLEKSQRVLNALAVSPQRPEEYLLSKLTAFLLISLLVALALNLASGAGHTGQTLLGTGLASLVFSLLGLLIAVNAESLNRFLILTVPIEIVCFTPAVLYLFDACPGALEYFPVCACMALVAGRAQSPLLAVAVLLPVIALLYYFSLRAVRKMWKSVGGIKL